MEQWQEGSGEVAAGPQLHEGLSEVEDSICFDGAKCQDSVAITDNESCEYAGWMGRVRRDVEVEVEGLFEESGGDYVAKLDCYCHVQKIYFLTLWAEEPFQPVVFIYLTF